MMREGKKEKCQKNGHEELEIANMMTRKCLQWKRFPSKTMEPLAAELSPLDFFSRLPHLTEKQ